MSSIVFSFDAEAVGALAAIDALVGAFGELVGAGESIVSSFSNIASSTATMMSAWGALMNNIGSMASSFNDASGAMGGASGSAANLSYELQRLGERAADAAEKHADAVAQIAQQEANLTENFTEQVQRREQAYNQSMERLVETHADTLKQINDQENNLSDSYLDQIDQRLKSLNDPRAVQHQTIVTALETQIAAMLSSGQTGGIQALENQLTGENTSYNAFLQNTIEPSYQFLDQKGYRSHQNALQQLQDRLSKEDQAYARQRQDLQDNYAQQMSDLQTHYNQEMALLQNHLGEENEAYAQQMRDISEERSHLMSSGGGGGGGGGAVPFGMPPQAAYIALFKQLGIDPHKNPIDAENALMKWVLGGKYTYKGKTTDFGYGQDTHSQMTIDQIYTVVSQALGFGQDPTRKMRGQENYVNLFSDLLAYSGALAPNLSPDARFNSLTGIMRKVLEGNTNQILRQLGTIGITPQDLEKYGVNFKGKTVQNPQQVFDALMSIAYEKSAGLGDYQAHATPAGVTNLIKDWWTSIVVGVTGNINDPASLIARFTQEYNRLVMFLFANRDKIIAFGQSVGEWLIGKFSNFIDYLNSQDFAKVLTNIGNAFHHIGDALAWMGQHKDIILLIGGLLAAQVGSKILGGLSLDPLKRLMSGGLFGTVGGTGTGAGSGLLGMLTNFATVRYRAGQEFGQDFGPMRAIYRGGPAAMASALHGFARNPDEGFFEYLGRAFGRDPGAARAAAFTMHPLGTTGIIGRQVAGNVARPIMGAASAVAGGVSGAFSMARGAGAALFGAYGAGGGGLGGIASVLSLLGGGIGPMLAGIGPALAGIAAAAGPIALVAAAVAGLIFLLVQNRAKIMPFINTLTHFFGGQLKQAEKAIMDFVHEVQERLGPAFGPSSGVYKALQFFSHFWSGAWGGIQLIFKGVWDVIVGIIKIAWSILSGIVLIGLDLLSGNWKGAWKDMQKMFNGIWDGIKQALGGALKILAGAFLGFFGGLWGLISGKATDFSQSFLNFFSQLPKKIGSFFSDLPKNIAATFTGFTTMVVRALVNNAGILKSPLEGLARTMHVPGFATGGYYGGGGYGPVKVGEEGEELFWPNSPGAIVSNAQIRLAMAGFGGNAGGRGINIYGDINLPNVRNAWQFYQELNQMGGSIAEYGRRGRNAR